LETAPLTDEADPDLLADLSERERCEVVDEYGLVLRTFRDVPYVVAGRLAALVQGVPVRVLRLDLVVAAQDSDRARTALGALGCLRWNERWQEFLDYDADPGRAGPMRWRVLGHLELRLELVERLPSAVTVQVGDRALPVRPLLELVAADNGLADLVRRAGRAVRT
jgi:hypothetical protein